MLEAADSYRAPLRSFMAADLYATRKRIGLSQMKMAELLEIDLRSYADLEHGKNLCCTRVFIFYALRCKPDRQKFMGEIESFLQLPESDITLW